MIKVTLEIEFCEEINHEEWNNLIFQSEYGTIFHTNEWVRLLEKEYGPKLLITARLEGKLVGVFPSIVNVGRFFDSLRSFNYGYDFGGPVSLVNDESILESLVRAFDKLAEKNYLKVKITLPLNWKHKGLFESFKFTVHNSITFVVDLTKSIDDLWKNLEGRARRAVRKAQKKKVEVRIAKADDIEIYYDLFVDTAKRAGFDPSFRSISFYRNLWTSLCEKGLAKIFLAEYKNQIISGIVFLTYKDAIIGFCSGTDNDFRNYEPNSLLFWKIIDWGNKNDFKSFDTAAANLPNLYKFKKVWGGKLIDHPIYSKEYASIKSRIRKLGYKIKQSF